MITKQTYEEMGVAAKNFEQLTKLIEDRNRVLEVLRKLPGDALINVDVPGWTCTSFLIKKDEAITVQARRVEEAHQRLTRNEFEVRELVKRDIL